MASTLSLTADEARRLFLRAQGVLGAPDRGAGVPGVLRSLGAIQLDTISVLARSHELVPYARLGAVGRATVESAYWGNPPKAFEYWAHAASVLPMRDWPWFAARRRRHRGWDWGSRQPSDAVVRTILDRLADGPCTATELGGAKRGGPWWDWSEAKIAVERLLASGDVVCVERRGWKRVYDLPERAIPAHLRALDLDDHQCNIELVRRAAAHLGVGTVKDIADYYRMRIAWVEDALVGAGLVPVTVAGWDTPAWADGFGLADPPRGRHRTTLLSPFDSLVWDRARTARVFGFEHKLEAYVPKALRKHGYFTMPLLAGGRLVGRVDPARDGRTLVARQVSLRASAVDAMAAALREAASWVGCDAVVVERVTPDALAAPLRAAVA